MNIMTTGKKKFRKKGKTEIVEISPFSSLKDIRENSPDVPTYLNLSEFHCRTDSKDFFTCTYKKVHLASGTVNYAYEIYNGRGQLVCRESNYFSYPKCRKEGEVRRLAFEAGYGALPELNSTSETIH